MSRPASDDDLEGPTKLSLALNGLNKFCDYISKNLPHEFLALLAYSSKCEVVVPFTKNHEDIKQALIGEEVFDKSDLQNALETVVEVVANEWGAFVPCQVVIVTDGLPGLQLLHTQPLPASFHFPMQAHVVVMATKEELKVLSATDPLSHLCTVLGVNEEYILFPSNSQSVDSTNATFMELAEKYFLPYCGTLKCGHLESKVSLVPSPYSHKSNVGICTSRNGGKFAPLKGLDHSLPSVLEVCGFVETSNIYAPPTLSRHLVLDVPVGETPHTEVANGNTDSDLKDQSQIPSFRVLLHGSLKVQSMVAVVRLRHDWFGLLYSGSEGKNTKKANLIISILHPGADIPWLGSFDHLGLDTPTGDTESFPIAPPRNLSFQNTANLSWISDSVLQNDLSKLVRYSRKLPDKETSYLKEYNKLRVTALTYCSPELLNTMVELLEAEKEAMSQPRGSALLDKAIAFLKTSTDTSKKLASGGNVI
jgi:hypothetical protein